MYHEPVLLHESIEGLAIQPDGIYVDATFGGGGHSKAILDKLSTGQLFAFDQDRDAQDNLLTDDKFTFVPENFRHLKRYLRVHGVRKVHGILADLGVSWHQFNTPERGFSIRFDEEALDMRMNQDKTLTAYDILHTYDIDKLTFLFKYYGELPRAYRVAEKIVQTRRSQPIKTVGDLKLLVQSDVKGLSHKFYAQLFQALRIEVNDELAALKELLTQCKEVLHPDGRLVIISYHSLEDRLVKNYIKKGNFEGKDDKDVFGRSFEPFKAINRKVIIPTTAEIKRNAKARSAKMRIAAKKENN